MIVLILEGNDTRERHEFYNTDRLEIFLTSINLDNYIRTNILVYFDNEINHKISLLYKNRYLK